ncbi:hypothetical protein T4B_7747 [Trichinella pseudospiralis]|uniref:Uncharacterized protein n=1 Tax=Trichinella pseudospiralis TaxID=6337 RepID=A0A0V1J1S5_TRIPS|nr:hypothetical protein T4B_7747 [Trichinella pseudospiralis]
MHLCDGTSKAGSSKEIPSNCKTLVTVRREKCILTHLRFVHEDVRFVKVESSLMVIQLQQYLKSVM